ncbi:unnamed protein product, partial [Darwinula stevensoni]
MPGFPLGFIGASLFTIGVFIIAWILAKSLKCNPSLMFQVFFGVHPGSLQNKVVWITGAGSGIGKQLALDLTKYGAKLVIHSLPGEDLDSLKEQCILLGFLIPHKPIGGSQGKISSEDIYLIHGDITSGNLHQQWVTDALKHFGQASTVIAGSFEETSVEDDRKMFEVNVFGGVQLTRALIPHFKERRKGHVVVTSSMLGRMFSPSQAVYSACKHALFGYYQALGIEGGMYGLDVTIICPGPVKTPLIFKPFSNVNKSFIDSQMLVMIPIDLHGLLAGQVIWITGASSGIGEALAIRLASLKARLILSARRLEELQRVKSLCLETSLGMLSEDSILLLPMDVTETEKHSMHLETIIKHFGKLDILVNNAGRSQRAEFQRVQVDVDRALFELNVFGPVALARTVLPHFVERGSGQVVITSSVMGKFAAPYSCSYAASKHALHGYFETLRAEQALSGVHVTLLCPGPVLTNAAQESFTDTPGQKVGKPWGQGGRMTSERCADLIMVAIVNHIDEAWISQQPVLTICYLAQYFPSFMRKAMSILGPRMANKLRDQE